MNVPGPRPVEASGYRLIRWLGTRDSASLYVAAGSSRDQPAAVKIFHRVDAEILARLEGKLQESARLSHPNIVPIDAIGRTDDGRLFYAMPLLLDFEQARRGLSGRSLRIAALLRDLLAGLDHAHRSGVVHGDIKPSNVLFDDQGRALLADFGIARCIAETHGEPASPHSDLHGIGMLAYTLFAGTSALPQHPAAPPASSAQLMLRLPPGAAAWRPWFGKALAQSPDQQFQDAQAMADALGAITGRGQRRSGGVRIPPIANQSQPQPKPAPGWPLRTALPIAAIVVLIGWGAWDYFSETAPTPDSVPAAASIETPIVPSAASAENPALPMAVAQPAATSAAEASSTVTLPARVQALIGTADTLRSQGHLFSPPFQNAASKYLAALMLDPGNRSAMAGIDATLVALRDRLDKTWHDGRSTTEAAGWLRQGDELSKHADSRSRRAWRSHRKRLAYRVGHAYARAAGAHDTLVLAALAPLAKALGVASPELDPPPARTADPMAVAPATGERMRDPHGPLLVYVPATGGLPAFAIAQVEVTRADYATFARATHRSPAACRAAHNPFSRLQHLGWRAPGFMQSGDQPVVCVSWDDAAAYAAWLSKTTGATYRLPSGSQWLRAAQGMPKGDPCQLGNVDDVSRRNRLDDDRWSCSDGAAYTAPVGHYAASGVGAYDMYGNVSEWVAGGSAGARAFRGISWRDGSHETPLGNRGAADSDVGYTSVGFRVVRVIDPAHPAPAVASSH